MHPAYAIMLHYCVTGQTIRVSDLRYDDQNSADLPAVSDDQLSAHGTYEAEQEMLRIVREGDIANFRSHMDRMSITGRMGKLSDDDPLRQMKNAVITCLVLFSRAAMEGGLHLEESLDLPALARQVGYSEYYLSRKFKKEIGFPPSEYIRRKRLERAAHLLRTTGEDIQKISTRLQFSSQSHFSDCFRKQYGQTPTAYRIGARDK